LAAALALLTLVSLLLVFLLLVFLLLAFVLPAACAEAYGSVSEGVYIEREAFGAV
jgi:ABC-type oligopeptide transport system substrate-binding subunit